MNNTNTAVTRAESTAVSKPATTVETLIKSQKFQDEVCKALPSHLTARRFLLSIAVAVQKTPKLKLCTVDSMYKSCLELSAFGLEANGRDAHLIPYGNECKYIIDYKGLVSMTYRSGDVVSLHADLICENDIFEYNLGEIRTHIIEWKAPRGEPYAVYAMAKMKSGVIASAVMSKDEIEVIRKASPGGNGDIWRKHWGEMAKKGLALDTPIPTPDGWSTMKDIQVGQRVFDMHGKPTLIIAKSAVKQIPCFRVNFTNGDSIVCDDEHRWLARPGRSKACKLKYRVMTVNEIFDAIEDGKSVTIPVQKPIEGCQKDLPIDPYLLGYWLGDGTSSCPAITCSKEDLEHVENMVKSSCYKLGKLWKDKRTGVFTVRIKGGMLQSLRGLNLLMNKHVPEQYMRSSTENRLSLLQGLMDSDGHVDKQRGRAHFYNTNERLSNAVYELVCSLGDVPFAASKTMNGFDVTCVAHFVGWKPTMCPVRLARKVANFQPRKISKYRAIASVESIASVPTQCIAVESDSKTYLAGKSMAVTHNTVFKRLSKWLPLSADIRDAAAADDYEEDEVAPKTTDTGTTRRKPIEAEAIMENQPEPETTTIVKPVRKPSPEPLPEPEPEPLPEPPVDENEIPFGNPEPAAPKPAKPAKAESLGVASVRGWMSEVKMTWEFITEVGNSQGWWAGEIPLESLPEDALTVLETNKRGLLSMWKKKAGAK